MRRVVLATMVLTTVCTGLPAAAPLTHIWSQRYGDLDGQTPEGVATDASGNIYLAGAFSGSVDFGGGNLVSAGGSDIFLVKFDPSGAYLWSHAFGDVANPQAATAIAVDAAGTVYVGGIFQGTVDFGGGPLVATAGDRDVFLAKFNSAGVHQWSKRFGDAAEQECTSVAVDVTGNVYAAGHFLGSMDFGGGPLTSAGSYDVYLAKFDASGAHQWSKRFGDTVFQVCAGVARDASGNVYLTGSFNGSVNFGGGNLTTPGATEDVFLAKFDPAGAHVWSHQYGDAGIQEAASVAADAGYVYVAGFMAGTTDFGGGPLTSAGGFDLFLVKFDTSGAHQWSERWGDGADQTSALVAVGPSGNVYLGGTIAGTVDFGGGPLVTQGIWDVFLAKFDASGVHQWSERFGDGSKYQIGTSVVADPSDNVILTGFAQGTIDFGGGPLVSAGSYDAFLAKFATLPTGVHGSPASESLSISAYPNPFNPETTIRYTVPSKGRVSVEVYDARGERIATLVDREKEAGAYTEKWDGRDAQGRAVSSGVYFARVTHPSGTKSYKMVLLK